MKRYNYRSRLSETAQAGILAIGFGFLILAFLVAIGHPEWFRLDPAGGTAAAMVHASAPPPSQSAERNDDKRLQATNRLEGS